MKEQLEAIRKGALDSIVGTKAAAELDSLRVKYLGKKGELTAVLKQMGSLSAEERPVMGQMANEVRAALEQALEAKGKELEAKALEDRLKAEALDVTVPGKAVKEGHRHPMYIALDEIKDIFIGMGFTVLDGPEVELAELNFDRLNADEGHPSRDWSDTFYFDEDSRVMLRSQTSPMQVRAMDSMPLPIRIIAPGRVYRKDEVDATHSPMFHQVEGMVIDKGVTMADLKGTLNTVVEQLYGKGTKTRFRPHHFPFTEPSCEMDVQCHKCGGVGCPTCKGEGWIELLGAGMIHPRVLELAGIVFLYFRMFSRNISKRYQENQAFLRMSFRVREPLKKWQFRFRESRQYHIYKCPSCGQKIRIPRGRGRVSIHCPKCGTDFIKKS